MREFKSRVQPGGAGLALMFAATAGLGVAMPGASAAQVAVWRRRDDRADHRDGT